ncbi:MAG TPA: class I SAM-dependent methyltransferase [Cyclobacteriaceae bacterium]|nr:class I SAM-dependent methyltransferase [Cyclobacteriaceae bacterium]
MLEQVTACPICGEKDFSKQLEALDYTTTRESFAIQRCDNCSLLLTNPRPSKESIGKYYQSEGYISHTGGGNTLIDKAYRMVRSRTLRSKLRLVNKYQSKFNLLDYGCGTGDFLATCKDAGWTVAGVEPSDDARTRARKDLDVVNDISKVKTQVNAITMWHVLEHVHDLNETMARMRSLLTNNGTIFIAVPNHESYDARYYKNFWAGYDVPRHLWHFNKENIKTLLTRHNLRLQAIQPMPFDSYYVSLLSEGYKHPGKGGLTKAASAFVRGWVSNMKAGRDNHSSLIYIAGS